MGTYGATPATFATLCNLFSTPLPLQRHPAPIPSPLPSAMQHFATFFQLLRDPWCAGHSCLPSSTPTRPYTHTPNSPLRAHPRNSPATLLITATSRKNQTKPPRAYQNPSSPSQTQPFP